VPMFPLGVSAPECVNWRNIPLSLIDRVLSVFVPITLTTRVAESCPKTLVSDTTSTA
jgi:hypothetical protein